MPEKTIKHKMQTPGCVVLNHWNQASKRTKARSKNEEISELSVVVNAFFFRP